MAWRLDLVDLADQPLHAVHFLVGDPSLLALPVNDVLDGDLVVGGDLELLVPANTTINVKAQGGSAPTFDFDRDRYDLLVGGELKNKAIDSFQYSLDVWMNGGATLIITDLE